MNPPNPACRPVVVAGVGQTGPVLEDPRSIPEMVLDAVEMALADAGMGFRDIDAVVTASVDLFDGLTASNVAVTEVVGAVMKPETRIAADGLAAAVHATCQIRSGAYETVLVVAHGKGSMSSHPDVTAWAIDPITLQPLGVNFLVCAGLQACAVALDDGRAERRWAQTVARRRRDAAGHGIAPAITEEEILASPIVASPLRRGMSAPLGDGACAVLLQSAAAGNRGGVRITGIGYDLSAHSLGERDLRQWEGLQRACHRATTMAGISDTATSFDLLEPSCRYPHEEELFLKAMGTGDGSLISPSGGLFAGEVPVAAGLTRLVAAVRWLRENRSAKRALAHGTWGPAGQGQVVTILEGAT